MVGWGVGTATMLRNEDHMTLKLCYTQGFRYTSWERGAGRGAGDGGLAETMLHSGLSVHILGEGRRVGWRGWGVGIAAMLHNENNLALELCYTQNLWDTYWKRGAGTLVRG